MRVRWPRWRKDGCVGGAARPLHASQQDLGLGILGLQQLQALDPAAGGVGVAHFQGKLRGLAADEGGRRVQVEDPLVLLQGLGVGAPPLQEGRLQEMQLGLLGGALGGQAGGGRGAKAGREDEDGRDRKMSCQGSLPSDIRSILAPPGQTALPIPEGPDTLWE